jgi:hypothetical protein
MEWLSEETHSCSVTPRTPLPAVSGGPAAGVGIARVLKRLHYPLDVMLLCVRWYVAYSTACPLTLLRQSLAAGFEPNE